MRGCCASGGALEAATGLSTNLQSEVARAQRVQSTPAATACTVVESKGRSGRARFFGESRTERENAVRVVRGFGDIIQF
jgi:hypothetical protein